MARVPILDRAPRWVLIGNYIQENRNLYRCIFKLSSAIMDRLQRSAEVFGKFESQSSISERKRGLQPHLYPWLVFCVVVNSISIYAYRQKYCHF